MPAERKTRKVPVAKGDACKSCRTRKVACDTNPDGCRACRRLAKFEGRSFELCDCIYDGGKRFARSKKGKEVETDNSIANAPAAPSSEQLSATQDLASSQLVEDAPSASFQLAPVAWTPPPLIPFTWTAPIFPQFPILASSYTHIPTYTESPLEMSLPGLSNSPTPSSSSSESLESIEPSPETLHLPLPDPSLYLLDPAVVDPWLPMSAQVECPTFDWGVDKTANLPPTLDVWPALSDEKVFGDWTFPL